MFSFLFCRTEAVWICLLQFFCGYESCAFIISFKEECRISCTLISFCNKRIENITVSESLLNIFIHFSIQNGRCFYTAWLWTRNCVRSYIYEVKTRLNNLVSWYFENNLKDTNTVVSTWLVCLINNCRG